MLRVYGWLSQVCGSVALAVLLLGMVAVVTHPAFAEDPIEVGINLLDCQTDCVCNLSPCEADICQNRDGCRTNCKCVDKEGGGCKCIPK
jgi:hypothetical protein